MKGHIMKELHQALMTQAYNRWNTKEVNSHKEMRATSSEAELVAVVLGNLNYQTENGGFNQWVSNGYCTAYQSIIEALNNIDTKTSLKVKEMVEEVGKFLSEEVLDGTCTDSGMSGDYYDTDKLDPEEETCHECDGQGEVENPDYDDEDEDCYEDQTIGCNYCDFGTITSDEQFEDPNFNHLDSRFYNINAALMVDIEVYLNKIHK